MKHDIKLSNENELVIEIDNRKTEAVFVQEYNPTEKRSFFSRFDRDGGFIEGSDELTDEAVAEIERVIGTEITWS